MDRLKACRNHTVSSTLNSGNFFITCVSFKIFIVTSSDKKNHVISESIQKTAAQRYLRKLVQCCAITNGENVYFLFIFLHNVLESCTTLEFITRKIVRKTKHLEKRRLMNIFHFASNNVIIFFSIQIFLFHPVIVLILQFLFNIFLLLFFPASKIIPDA